MVPPGATSWVLARPRAIFTHPRLGAILARAFDDAGDQALFDRARRVGYDVRTVERAMVAWRGPTTVAVGMGAFDVRRIETLLWDRLLPPRERLEANGVLRTWGFLGYTPVALAVWNACPLVAYAEGPGTVARREIERLRRAHDEGDGDDPDGLVLWHGAGAPAILQGRDPTALLEAVRDVELSARQEERGVRVALRLDGRLPPDADTRLRRALATFMEEPLGHAMGAPQWLRDEGSLVTVEATHLTAETLVPWSALDALADVLRGRVDHAPRTYDFFDPSKATW